LRRRPHDLMVCSRDNICNSLQPKAFGDFNAIQLRPRFGSPAQLRPRFGSPGNLAASPFRLPVPVSAPRPRFGSVSARVPVSARSCVPVPTRVAPGPSKTRFRLPAQLCRAGLVTRRVPMKGFCVSAFYFPKLSWRTHTSTLQQPGRCSYLCRPQPLPPGDRYRRDGRAYRFDDGQRGE
jgi:hypothetical protein